KGSQPCVLWSNRQLARHHRRYSGEVLADVRKMAEQLKGAEAALADRFALPEADEETEKVLRGELDRFCAVFPGAFVVTDRGPYYNPKEAGRGRLLTAGFHLMQGYFRDDDPLCDLVLDERQR